MCLNSKGPIPMPRIDYLYQRPGSSNWYLKLQKPNGEVLRKSLGTANKLEAEIAAAPMIPDHKRSLLLAKLPGPDDALTNAIWEETAGEMLPPGEHVLPASGRVIVTADGQMILLDRPGGPKV